MSESTVEARRADASASGPLLAGRHVVVLGASGEVGEGIVRRLLAHGARVSAVSRSDARLAQLVARLEATYPADAAGDWRGRLARLTADVSDAEDGPRLRDALGAAPVHGVVASLGGWRQGARVVDTSPAAWDEALAQSLGAHYHAARLLLPLVADVAHGSYTLVNGGGATRAVPGAGAMCVSAAGQLMLKDVLAVEHRDAPVRINALLLATPVRTRSRPTGAEGWITADDAGEWAAHLASSRAPYRGETLTIGGATGRPAARPADRPGA